MKKQKKQEKAKLAAEVLKYGRILSNLKAPQTTPTPKGGKEELHLDSSSEEEEEKQPVEQIKKTVFQTTAVQHAEPAQGAEEGSANLAEEAKPQVEEVDESAEKGGNGGARRKPRKAKK